MARANTMSIFEVEQITVRWVADSNCYHVVFEGGADKITVNAWGDHGDGPAPEIIVESYAPRPEPEDKPVPGIDLPNEELDV